MPHCAVIWCNNQSKNVNKQNSGVSYHKFPNNPYVKEKWIRATGKCKWSPQKHDTICSQHFEPDNFTKKSAKTYLLFDAIPTLNLHPIFEEIDSLYRNTNNIQCTTDPIKRRKKEIQTGLSPAKRRKKVNSPDFASVIRTNERNLAELGPPILIKEGEPANIGPAILIKEEHPPDLTPAIVIKVEDPSGIATEIQIKEADKDPSGLVPPIRIKEDPSELVPGDYVKKEDPNNLIPTICVKEEDPLAQIEVTVEVTKVEPVNDSHPTQATPRESYYTPNNQDSPQTRHLKLSLMTAQETIKRQRLQVKRIRESRRRLSLKLTKMENIIKCLREQSANNS